MSIVCDSPIYSAAGPIKQKLLGVRILLEDDHQCLHNSLVLLGTIELKNDSAGGVGGQKHEIGCVDSYIGSLLIPLH